MQKIPIAFSTNNKFAAFTSVAIESIIQNSNINNEYDIYVFHTRLSDSNIKKLESIKAKNVKVECLNITSYINLDDFYETKDYTYEIYYRYYASYILKYDKIIYLDSDIIVIDDIANLFNENIENHSIAAITDFEHYMHPKNLDFNSGVMIINSKRFEENKIREKCIELIKKRKFKLPDQEALNIICKNDTYRLLPKYNFQLGIAYCYKFKKKVKRKKYKKIFFDKQQIIHFTGITKPTNNIFSKYSKEFWQYAKYSPYYETLLNQYLSDPYEVLKQSPVEDIFIELTEEGKVGLRKIIDILLYELKFWFLYKLRRGKDK